MFDRDESCITNKQDTRRRRRPKISVSESARSQPLLDFVEDHALVLLFLLDENQPHCIQLRHKLLAYEKIPIICLTPKPDMEFVDAHFLIGSGWGLAHYNSSLQALLQVSHVPSLMVLKNGLKISGANEELALNNAVEHNLSCWEAGRSGLSVSQKLQSCSVM